MATVGRDRELQEISAFLRDEEGALVLLLEGEAGIGKTTVWKEAAASAVPRYRVLRARPVEIEGGISFAAVGDLIGGVLAEVQADLPFPQRRALERALVIAEHPGAPPEPEEIAFAFLSTLRALARTQRILIAVDDIQWLDQPSAAVLLFAARRIGDDAIRFVLAERTGSSSVPLTRAISDSALQHVLLGPLTPGAIQHVLHEQLGVTLARPTLHLVHKTSGGNPFYALELARGWMQADGRVDAGEPPKVPASLTALVDERLAALQPETETALHVAALLADPTVDVVTSILGAPVSLRPAVDARVIEIDGRRIQFTHPLLASGLAARIEPRSVPELHRRIAAAVIHPEERARHLARAADGVDPDAPGALDLAARHGRDR